MISELLLRLIPGSPGQITKKICSEFSKEYPDMEVYEFCEVHFEESLIKIDAKKNKHIADTIGMGGELDLMDMAGESLFGYCYMYYCLLQFDNLNSIQRMKAEILKVITSVYEKSVPKELKKVTDHDLQMVNTIDLFFASMEK